MAKNYKRIISILGHDIPLGTSKEINFNIAKLHTATIIEVPVIIERSKKPGPTILFTAGIHGDEINGVDIVRQLIAKKINKPKTRHHYLYAHFQCFWVFKQFQKFP